jgi:glycosyltransferase involved in cell wall biosynthesis
MPEVTIVVPAYNEARNLPLLYNRLHQVMESLKLEWEWIVIDDHSSDETFEVISLIAAHDSRAKVIRLARNYGSHTAIACGLQHAEGACVIVMAADLQDPPETIPEILAQWRQGAQVVWAARRHRQGEKVSTIGLARLYYFLMRHAVGIRAMPAGGADFFLLDRCVIDAVRQFNESNVSITILIAWMGFRQATITYDKQARVHGRSGWSLEKKLKLLVDSITSFSYLPIRLISYLGCVVALVGFLFAGMVIAEALTGNPTQGWASLMVVTLTIGGMQMLMMGVLGEYLWRALDESRRRPRFIVEATMGQAALQARDDSIPAR